MTQKPESSFSRRHLLAIGGGSAALYLSDQTLFAQSHTGITVRDRLWLWGHPAGAHNKDWGLSEPSRITPVEAAYYMSIPNVVMVRYSGKPEMPFDQYAIPFRPLKQVVWSVVGAGGE